LRAISPNLRAIGKMTRSVKGVTSLVFQGQFAQLTVKMPQDAQRSFFHFQPEDYECQ
jgi:hypothetical protein